VPKSGTGRSRRNGGEGGRSAQGRREKAVKAIKDGEQPKLPKPKAVIASRDVEKLYEAVKAELADYKERYETLGETARELQDKLEMYEATEPDEQQKMIANLQKTLQRKDGEIARQRGQISDLNNKCNALIRQVKSLQKKAA
jgi:chromosome segregation ATPase